MYKNENKTKMRQHNTEKVIGKKKNVLGTERKRKTGTSVTKKNEKHTKPTHRTKHPKPQKGGPPKNATVMK